MRRPFGKRDHLHDRRGVTTINGGSIGSSCMTAQHRVGSTQQKSRQSSRPELGRLRTDFLRKQEMVLPDRIELSTSPFITLTLSRPPRRGVCALDHPFAIDP
jgi:hypothetical protein